MRKPGAYHWQSLSIGTCYYPEQWSESMWRDDIARMLASGIRCIRIAEFAWSKVEPEEGVFTFDFYDRFLALMLEMGMKVIFGTPTATPPAWLTERYPETLNCRKDGVPYRHGMRRHCSYNSPVYQKLCKRVVVAIASHYGQHPSIVGWQIDNELNCETADFYSPSDSVAFRAFLRDRYETLERLNEAWGTVFWNQTYTDWQEIHVPRVTVQDSVNPHQTLDYLRFVSDSAVRFCKMQSDVIRKYCKPGDFITTNGMFGHLDNHRMTDEALDVYTYDSYPNFAYAMAASPGDSLRDRKWSGALSEVRSICPHFGIMEQQSGAMGWNTRMESPAPKPGQMTLWAMQSVAHGADYVSFFRWRTACMGTEMYWHGILDYDNRDNRRLRELRSLAARFERLQAVTGADSLAGFAVVRDYDNVWDAEVDCWHGRVHAASEDALLDASQHLHAPMDYLYLLNDTEAEELLRYRVLFCPHAVMLTERHAALLRAYVERGGTLVLCARTGQKNAMGHCVMQPMPGLLSDLTHTRVEEYSLIGPADEPVTMTWQGREVSCGVFNDVLSPTDADAEVLARYRGSYYTGEPALIRRQVGRGSVMHFGGTLTRESARLFLEALGLARPWRDTLELPEGCELTVRGKGDDRFFFVLNYEPQPAAIVLRRPVADAESGETVCGGMELAPYGVRVFRA